MLVPVQVRARSRPRRLPARGRGGHQVAPAVSSRHGAVLDLQRTAGNRAVAGLFRSPVVQPQRDHPPIKNLVPGGTLDAAAWATVHGKAKAALAKGDASTAESMYLRLLADAATVAGVTVLTGFDPKQIHVYKGVAKAGLNLSLDRGDEPGHVGWVDAAGKFGVPLDFSKSVPAVQFGLMSPERAATRRRCRCARSAMRWSMCATGRSRSTPSRSGTPPAAGQRSETWVAKNAKRLRLSDTNVALVQKGSRGGQVDYRRSSPTSRAS